MLAMGDIDELLASGLGLAAPWAIQGLGCRQGRDGRLQVVIRLRPLGQRFKGSDGRYRRAHDIVERVWRHLPPFGDGCLLHACVPRLREGSGVRAMDVPWARRGSGLTLAFERHCLKLLEGGTTVREAADRVGAHPKQLWGILRHWVSKLHAAKRIGDLDRMGVVRIPTGMGGRYLTSMVDLRRRWVLQTVGGTPARSMDRTLALLKGRGADIDAIAYVCTGLSLEDIEACERCLPQAKVVVARHHVMELVRQALREAQHPVHGDEGIHGLTDLFRGLWEMADAGAASGCLAYCCDRAKESGLAPLVALADTILACWGAIVGALGTGIDDSALGSVHREVVSTVRSGRGYRDLQNLCLMVHLRLGGLDLDEVAPR